MAAAVLGVFAAPNNSTPKEARVTQIIREVKLLPSNANERDALVDDKVAEDTGVRTGGDSRSELTFADLTITRLGANTIFSFNKAGRTVNLEGGSVLLRVPKDSGGGVIHNNVVTVAITGTTIILETTPDGASRLIALEGTARLSFTKDPAKSRRVRAGQLLDVPAGATTLPMPVNFDINEMMRTHPLIVDFQPLPSLPLIQAVAKKQPPPSGPTVQRRPPPSGPIVGPPVVAPPPTSGPVAGGPGKNPPQTSNPHPIVLPTPSPTPRITPTPRASPTPRDVKPSPTPTPRGTPRYSPTPKPPKPTPTASPKHTRPPSTNQPPGTTKPPVVSTNPTPTPTPVILRRAPSQTTTTNKPPPTPTPSNLTRRKPVIRRTPPPGPR